MVDSEFLLETLSDPIFRNPAGEKRNKTPGSSPPPPAATPRGWRGCAGRRQVEGKTPTDTPPPCGSLPAVFVRSPFRGGRALPRLAGRWRGWFTKSHCRSGKGASTSSLSPSRWDPGSGEKPGPTLEGDRGGAAWQPGRREGGRPRQQSGPLQTSGEMYRDASGAGPLGCRLRCRRWPALRWLHRRPGHRGTDQSCLRPQEVGRDTHGASAEAAARIPGGPVSHHHLRGRRELWGPGRSRGAVGAQSCSNRSRRLRGPTVMSVQPQVPALALELFASPPEPGLAGPGSRIPPGKDTVASPQPRPSRGVSPQWGVLC